MGRIRRLFGRLRKPHPRPGAGVHDAPPDDEPALVPRRPRPTPSSGAAVLDFPPPPDDVDARGREVS